MAESIRLYVFAAKGLTREEFCRAYPDPVLVLSPFSSVEGTGAITRIAHGGGKVSVVPFQAVRVKKRHGANPFRNMVTIGRASNNDIELKASEVSKFHGYLTTDATGAVCYADAGSTNGSSVNGVPIPAKSTQRLAPGDELSLGGILVTFHDPHSFYGFLRAVVGDGEVEEV
ncbi:MAG: FHA domain-containing protein [Planctomycetes bacterium]|nr:FHA domain-containing protein [Planctomycetota bacterium]